LLGGKELTLCPKKQWGAAKNLEEERGAIVNEVFSISAAEKRACSKANTQNLTQPLD